MRPATRFDDLTQLRVRPQTQTAQYLDGDACGALVDDLELEGAAAKSRDAGSEQSSDDEGA
ncbi:MAG TPA: hypothetical protein VEA41_04780 [Salinarimonas sp.]|nr:hypothetical protein [Salinarimonas sp.]